MTPKSGDSLDFQRSAKESQSGSPIWSQCGDVTGSLPCGLTPFLLGSVAAAGATGGELLLGVFGPEALAGDLDEVRPVGQRSRAAEASRGSPKRSGHSGSVAIRGHSVESPCQPPSGPRSGLMLRSGPSGGWFSRGVGPAGVGVSASRARRRSTASAPSSTAARSSSAGWSPTSVAGRLGPRRAGPGWRPWANRSRTGRTPFGAGTARRSCMCSSHDRDRSTATA